MELRVGERGWKRIDWLITVCKLCQNQVKNFTNCEILNFNPLKIYVTFLKQNSPKISLPSSDAENAGYESSVENLSEACVEAAEEEIIQFSPPRDPAVDIGEKVEHMV